MTSWQIYWLTRLDSISAFTSIAGVLSTIAVGGLGITWLIAHDRSMFSDDSSKIWVKPLCVSIFACILSWVVCIFIPNTKEMAVIIVAPKLYSAINANEDLKKIPANVIGLANAWLEELKAAPKEKP